MSKRTGLTLDDGLMIWKARDAYTLQQTRRRQRAALWAVTYFAQGLMALMALMALVGGLWRQAGWITLLIATPCIVRWALCTGLPRLGRWVRRTFLPWRNPDVSAWTMGCTWYLPRLLIALALLLAVVLSGCTDMATHGNRLIWGIDCRPEAMRNGQCAMRGA